MHDCQGDAEITVKIKFKTKGQFNSNYRGGIEVLEDFACDELVSLLPGDFGVEILDVSITNYELKDQEREVEHD
jgi:hypothetical protein